MDQISRLQKWFFERCDGDWEHSAGFRLENLDNPGWALSLDLDEIGFHVDDMKTFSERTEHDWIAVKVDNKKLKIACGPLNLEEALERFFEIVRV